MPTQPFYTPKFRAFDSNGDPLAGGLLYTYAAGTSTPLATYTTRAGDVANANPVVLDANGEANVWLTPSTDYKFELRNSASVVQWTVDNVPALPELSLVPLRLGDGTVAAPALSFSNDTDCGIYRIGANNLGVGVNGAKVVDVSPTGLGVTGTLTTTGALTASGRVSGTGAPGTSGGSFSNGTAATSGTRQDAATLANGDLDLSGVTDPASTTAISDRLTPKNLVKVWASVSANNTATPTVHDAFNVESVSDAGDVIRVSFAADMANTNYSVQLTGVLSNSILPKVSARNAGYVEVSFFNASTGAAVVMANYSGMRLEVLVMGVQ
jgi:hypothetical protein